MMTTIKNFQISLIALFLTAGIISNVLAIAPTKRTRCHGGVYVDIEAFNALSKDAFLSDFPFAESNLIVPIPSLDTTERFNKIYTFHPEHDWGYRVALGYDLPTRSCCNYGFSLEFTHLDNDDHNLVDDQFDERIGAPILRPYDANALASIIVFTEADVKLNTRFNTLDLLGHTNFTVCNCVDLQVFAGARYLTLRQDYHNHLFVQDKFREEVIDRRRTVFTQDIHANDRFGGAGPRIGTNLFYQVACGLGLTAEVAGNLIFGVSRDQYIEELLQEEFSSDTPPEPTGNDTFFLKSKSPHETRVIPGLSGKIGITYSPTFPNCSSLAIEVGYRGDKYFRLIDHNDFIQAVNAPLGNAGTLQADRNSTSSRYFDFDLSGPYISFTYHA